MSKIRLLVVDDHPVVRAGLHTLLSAQSDMEVVGEATDGAMAVELASELQPDVVVMDITMPGMSGLDATRKIRELGLGTRVLVLTMHNDEEYLRQMLEEGATGYLLKQAADTELVVAIRAVHRGEVFVYPSFTRVILGDLIAKEDADAGIADVSDRLSQRERQVLKLVALGHTNLQISKMLYLSVKTVETYRSRVMTKLGLRNRAALVRYALQNGLLDETGQPT